MSNLPHEERPESLWPGVLLAFPALLVLLGLFLNALLWEPRLWRGAWLEGFMTTALFGGGMVSLLTTPLLFFYAVWVGRTMSSSARAVIYVLLGMGVLAMILVVRYLVGLSDLS